MPRLRGTLAPVFWPRARTCDLNRRPRYAFGREHAHGTKILDRAPRARIIAATGEKSGLAESVMRYYLAARCPGLGRGIERNRVAS